MSQPAPAPFDEFATDYDAALGRGLAVSGENREFFARGRVAWLATCFRQQELSLPNAILDFGCGTGSTAPILMECFRPSVLIGVDTSSRSLEIASRRYAAGGCRFMRLEDFRPAEQIDLVFCNGVFHHIPPADRPATVDFVFRSLRDGGVFAFWENNPWNPGTRWVMSRIPFDRDAILLGARPASRLLAARGLEILRTDHCFVFPRFLRWFRRWENAFSSLPIGAQYLVLAHKPSRPISGT